MQLINGITNQPSQQLTVPGVSTGTNLVIQLLYRQSQSGWFFGTLNWNNGQWVENGRRVVTHPNMLGQYINQIPFGIACLTTNGREPTQQGDFLTGASNLYLLSAAEVLEVQATIQGLKNG